MLKKYLEIYFKGQTNINILLWPDGDVCLQTFTSCFHRLLKWHQCVFWRQLSRKWSGSFVEVTTEHVQNFLFDSALFLKCLQQSYLNQKWPRFLLYICLQAVDLVCTSHCCLVGEHDHSPILWWLYFCGDKYIFIYWDIFTHFKCQIFRFLEFKEFKLFGCLWF